MIGHIGRDKVRRQSSLHANIYFRSVCCYGDLLRENIYNNDLLFRSNFVGCFNGDRCAPGFYAGNTNDGVPVFVKQHIGDLGIAGCDVQTSADGVVRRDGEGHFKKAADSNRNLFIGNRDALNLDLRNTYDPRHYLYTAFCQKGIQIVSSNSGRPWFQSSKRIGPGLLKRILILHFDRNAGKVIPIGNKIWNCQAIVLWGRNSSFGELKFRNVIIDDHFRVFAILIPVPEFQSPIDRNAYNLFRLACSPKRVRDSDG